MLRLSVMFTALNFCKAMWIAYQCVQGQPNRYEYFTHDDNKKLRLSDSQESLELKNFKFFRVHVTLPNLPGKNTVGKKNPSHYEF